jgi:hypothetical protein
MELILALVQAVVAQDVHGNQILAQAQITRTKVPAKIKMTPMVVRVLGTLQPVLHF